MAEPQSNTYKNERRNQARIITREALFVSEYIKIKYEDTYNEAAAFYNEINKMHARKPDLRKSLEFRVWKNRMAAAKGQPQTHIPRPKEHYYNRTQYRDITLVPPTGKPKEKRMPNNLLTANLNIPLLSIPQHATTKGIVNDQATEPPAVDTVPIQTALMQEGDQTATPSINDDLLIDPSITDELMPEIVAQIINDLQADPSIKDLLGDIDNIEEEIPELQIDLPEPTDYLEEEMMRW